MTDIDILHGLFLEKAFVHYDTTFNVRSVILKERQCPECVIEVKGIPSDSVILDLDNFPSFNSILGSIKGIKKRADFVLISEEEKCIIIIELKKSRSTQEEIVQQLKGAKCLMDYIVALGKMYCHPNFLSNFRYYYVSVFNRSINKRPIVPSPKNLNTEPKAFMKVGARETIRFREFLPNSHTQ